MKRSVRYLSLSTALLVSSLAHAKELPSFNAIASAPAASKSPAAAVKAAPASALGVPVSMDEKRGVPTFLWASRQMKAAPAVVGIGSAEQAARFYLNQLAPLYNLSPEALKTAVVQHVHDIGRGGIIVTLRQEVNGVEMYRNDVKVLLRRNLELVAVGGNLHPDAVPLVKNGTFTVPAGQAVANAVNDLYGTSIPGSSIVDLKQVKARFSHFDLAQTQPVKAAGLRFNESARAKKVFFPMPEGLVPAYYVEVFAADPAAKTNDVYGYVIAADDGRLLSRENLTQDDAYSYRVWAEAAGDKRPLDSPMGDFAPHPTGAPGAALPVPEFTASALVSIEGFNTNPNGVPDPWLPPGATETLGNNVDAYTDHTKPDGILPDGFRAATTAANTFDYTYDTALAPLSSPAQSMAATVNLFYVNNWLHDWWYDSGFDEAAGNAQQSNFGRGGVEGDVLHVEAQDGALDGSRNNANMSTPADGQSPRMQMFLWAGRSSRSLAVQPLNVSLNTGTASFGPQNFNVSGELVYVDDGVVGVPASADTPPGTVNDGCETPFANAAAVAGKIALIDVGFCGSNLKTAQAEANGAIAAILVNNKGTTAPTLGAGTPQVPVNIPTLSISLPDGNTIKTALQGGPLTISMSRLNEVERDGTIDNTIIAHEWGHYWHHRLVNCGNDQCRGQSEGWGDFSALMMTVREGDDLDAVFPLAQYSTLPRSDAYYGIRRVPYTTDVTKNAFTFKHIANGEAVPAGHPISGGGTNFEVHNVGEIWANFLFEAYISLLKTTQAPGATLTFEEARRLMGDYLVGGMKLAPAEATIIEQRDAILAYVLATNPDHFPLFFEAFAKRGAGACAVSPERYSSDGVGAVESFDLKAELQIMSVELDDAVKSCDSDGFLDAEETGHVTVKVRNTGLFPMTNIQVDVASAFSGLTFMNGVTQTIPTLAPFEATTLTFDVALADSVTGVGNIDLSVTVANEEACEPTRVDASVRYGNSDNLPGSAKVDTVESTVEVWTLSGDMPVPVWGRLQTGPSNHLWYGSDVGTLVDARLESPDLQVDLASNFVLSFEHKYEFETTLATQTAPARYWDGGQVEVSTDGGQTWADVSSLVSPGYNGKINSEKNPIHGKEAFVGKNPSWPGTDKVTLDFGKAFAGKTVRVRFRLATDTAAGAPGWEIDNIALQGVTNKPFSALGDDAATCQHAPTAVAGADVTALAEEAVELDASASSDPDGDALTFAWAQTAGPEVALTDAATTKASFTAPKLAEDTTLTFEVTVSDGKASASDLVDVLVKKAPEEPTGVGGGTGGGGTGGNGTGGGGTGGSGTGGNGTGGNGTGGSSSDTSSSASAGGSDPGSPAEAPDGCGCKVAGAPTEGGYLASLLGAAALLLRRRRRNGGR